MSEPVKPSGDIDALARRLPRLSPTPERSMAMRRAVLEAAESSRREWPRPRLGWWIGAAAAAAAVWAVIALRASDRAHEAATDRTTATTTVAAPGADRASATAAPSVAVPGADRASAAAAPSVAAPHGRLAEGVTAVDADRPVQLARGNATVTAPPGARFDVEVHDDQIVRVAVKVGWVIVAASNIASTMIAAHETWSAPTLNGGPPPAAGSPAGSPVPPPVPPPASVAPRDPAHGPAPLPSPSSAAEPQLPAFERMPPAASSPSPAPVPSPPERARLTEHPPQPAAPPPAPSPSAASEQSFHDGLRALLAGDIPIAASALDRACAAPSTIQQDACYWAAVAWRRTGDRARARTGFAEILARWPHSTHAGEASVWLGWLLLEAGERAEARLRFAAGAADPTPGVRADALRGLSAAR